MNLIINILGAALILLGLIALMILSLGGLLIVGFTLVDELDELDELELKRSKESVKT